MKYLTLPIIIFTLFVVWGFYQMSNLLTISASAKSSYEPSIRTFVVKKPVVPVKEVRVAVVSSGGSTSKIRTYVLEEARKAKLNVALVDKVAMCESKYNPLAKNPNSTAKGLFQFLDSTWKRNCVGDVFNYKDNTRCFIKHFPTKPNWWRQCLP